MSNAADATEVQDRAWTAIPARVFWLVVVLCSLGPYVLFASLSSGPKTSLFIQLAEFVWCLIILLGAATIGRRTHDVRLIYLTGIALIVAAQVYWWASGTLFGATWVFPVFMLLVLYRIARVFSTFSISDENRTSFIIEAILSGISGLLLLVDGVHGASRNWLITLLVIGILLRMYAMWHVERAQTASYNARGSWIWILVMTACVVVLGPKLLYYAFVALFVGGAAISIPVVYLLSSLIPIGKLHQRAKPPTQPQGPSKNQAPPHFTEAAASHHWILITLYILFVAAAVWYIWRRIRSRKYEAATDVVESEVAVARNWISRKTTLQFLETNNPVRRQYQEWVSAQHEAGFTMQSSETPRQFERRVILCTAGDSEGSLERNSEGNLDTEQGKMSAAQSLRKAYERVRYGKRKDADGLN